MLFVPQGAWFQPYVDAAAAAGLVSGVGGGKYDPNSSITREQMAVLIMNAFKMATKKSIADEAKKSSANFDDAGSISSYANDAVLAAQANGIINGLTATSFAPKQQAQRAQAAAMLIKLLAIIE